MQSKLAQIETNRDSDIGVVSDKSTLSQIDELTKNLIWENAALNFFYEEYKQFGTMENLQNLMNSIANIFPISFGERSRFKYGTIKQSLQNINGFLERQEGQTDFIIDCKFATTVAFKVLESLGYSPQIVFLNHFSAHPYIFVQIDKMMYRISMTEYNFMTIVPDGENDFDESKLQWKNKMNIDLVSVPIERLDLVDFKFLINHHFYKIIKNPDYLVKFENYLAMFQQLGGNVETVYKWQNALIKLKNETLTKLESGQILYKEAVQEARIIIGDVRMMFD